MWQTWIILSQIASYRNWHRYDNDLHWKSIWNWLKKLLVHAKRQKSNRWRYSVQCTWIVKLTWLLCSDIFHRCFLRLSTNEKKTGKKTNWQRIRNGNMNLPTKKEMEQCNSLRNYQFKIKTLQTKRFQRNRMANELQFGRNFHLLKALLIWLSNAER